MFALTDTSGAVTFPRMNVRMKAPVNFISMANSTSQKRAASDCNFDKSNSKKCHWSQGLLSSMNDPALKIDEDDKVVIIKDKYAKAKYHYLVLPVEQIPNLKALKSHHNVLLRHMEKKAKEIAEKHPEAKFRYGFHAIPSMSHLHLHLISQDFDSPCLKTKKHWNSFNTRYFLDSEEVIRYLEENGEVKTITAEAGRKLLDSPLKCHKCSYMPKNMPKLKEHLGEHLKD